MPTSPGLPTKRKHNLLATREAVVDQVLPWSTSPSRIKAQLPRHDARERWHKILPSSTTSINLSTQEVEVPSLGVGKDSNYLWGREPPRVKRILAGHWTRKKKKKKKKDETICRYLLILFGLYSIESWQPTNNWKKLDWLCRWKSKKSKEKPVIAELIVHLLSWCWLQGCIVCPR